MDERVSRFITRNDEGFAYPNDSRILMEALRLSKKPIETLIKMAMERVGPKTDEAHHIEDDKFLTERAQLRKMYRNEPDLELLSQLTANDSLGG